MPSILIALGTACRGLLTAMNRKQSIAFRLPEDWNGNLSITVTIGLRK